MPSFNVAPLPQARQAREAVVKAAAVVAAYNNSWGYQEDQGASEHKVGGRAVLPRWSACGHLPPALVPAVVLGTAHAVQHVFPSRREKVWQ